VAHVEDAPARLAHDREGLGQEVVEALAAPAPVAAALEAAPELLGLGAELVVGERADRALQRADALDDGADRLQLPLVLGPDDLGEYGINQGAPPFLARQNSSEESVPASRRTDS